MRLSASSRVMVVCVMVGAQCSSCRIAAGLLRLRCDGFAVQRGCLEAPRETSGLATKLLDKAADRVPEGGSGAEGASPIRLRSFVGRRVHPQCRGTHGAQGSEFQCWC